MSAGRPTDPPAGPILTSAQVDDLARGVLALARELWVVADRQIVLEAVLERHGIAPDEVDSFQPDAALTARMDARREAMLERLLHALGVPPEG